ncbi:MAG: chromosome segregation protein SMC [Coriobacteriales bacterium]|jgi:chromosome segregation protein|nr:chromosome segregation protein SMC [Coriobacteriales bacterium]
MYLRSLTIKGFKSFADRSVMNFEEGVSVIVGPNGSGKSNVSEAVLWVLGEQKSSNLRVQAMEELIFSGSSARQAVGVAEVELVLDNADGKLPIEFEQVAIMRRMYRNGESEYFINGSPCRRMDVIDVLFDSGIGQGAHSIIGQGSLTAVLESRPSDRRALVEEAAGILKHKKRREKASRKLAVMDASLERVNDIVRVIESQLRPLERQAARAQQHRSLSGELAALELALAVDDLRTLQGEWGLLDHREKEIGAEAELVHFRLNEREAELSKRQLALEEKGLFAGDLNEQRIRCQSIIQRLDAGMLVLEEKGRNMVSRLSDLRAQVHNSQTRLKAATEEFEGISEKLSEGQGRVKALYAQFNDLGHDCEQALKEKNQAEEAHARAAAALRSHQAALDTAQLNLAKATDALGSLDVEEALLKESHAQIEGEFTGTQDVLVQRRSRLDALEAQLVKEKADSNLAKSDIDKRVRLLDDRRQKLDQQRDALAAIQAEVRALEEIDRAFETASPMLNWIREHRDGLQGVVGPIAEALRLRADASLPFGMRMEEGEALIERLLGADLFGLLVEDEKAAARIAERLHASGERGEIALVPLRGPLAPEGRSPRGERLVDYLEFPDTDRDAVESLLGDLYLAPSIAEAQKYRLRDTLGVRFATPEGAVVWPSGKLTLGMQLNDVDSVLARRRRLDRLNEDAEAASAQLSDVELEVSVAEQNLQVAQQDGFEISQRLAKVQGDCDAAREELVRLEEVMTQLLARREGVERKLADVARRRSSSLPLASGFEERIAQLTEGTGGLEAAALDAEGALKKATDEKNEVAERLSAAKVELETAKGSSTYLKSRFEALRLEMREIDEALKVSRQTEANLDVIRQRIDPLYQIYEHLHVGATTWAGKLRDQAQLEQTDSKNLRSVINEANAAVEEARGELEAVNGRLTELRVEKARFESEVEHAISRITEGSGVPLESALGTPSPEDRQQAEDQADRLRRKLGSMGAVNHVAMEEFEALKRRRDYTLSQVEDLREARKALAKIERALDRKMKNQFLETFEQVNRNFQEVFGMLFPGGFGQLLLIEGDEQDDLGIEVSAQPRGKKITKLSLMSGGEKSLTALALLFAVYRIRDVPFYILDEVEAALDDTNLSRLIDYFDQIRRHTQLILVTHQRRTMEAADVLYGVTMQAAGVSKLVSQRLDQALRHVGGGATDGEAGGGGAHGGA